MDISRELGMGPWAELVAEQGIDVRLVVMPSGLRGSCAWVDGRVCVAIERSLSRAERRAVAAHELEHVRRGDLCEADEMPESWWAVWRRDELAVDVAVSQELVPAVELDVWLGRMASIDEPVLAVMVACEWDVPVRLAVLALEDAHVRARLRDLKHEQGQSGCVPFTDLPADTRAQLRRTIAGSFGADIDVITAHYGPTRVA